jgi:hypothetical protein
MRRFLRRSCAEVLLLLAIVTSSALAAAPAFAAGSAPAAVRAAVEGWTFYNTYPSHASCIAAGKANPQGKDWRCLKSAQSDAFDLYLSG